MTRVLYPFLGDSLGGSHLSALTLIEALDRSRFDPVVLLHGSGVLETELARRGVPYVLEEGVRVVEHAGPLTEFARALGNRKAVSSLLRRLGVDIVHTNDARMHRTWTFATRLAGAHPVWHQRTPGSRRHALFQRAAAAVVVISEYVRGTLPRAMATRARTVANPVRMNTELYAAESVKREFERELGITPNTPVVCWVANLQERKRPQVFIELAKRVHSKRGGEVVFCMFGDPREPATSDVRARIGQAGLDRHVFLMGTRTPIEPYVARANVLVSTAINEAFGRTLVEAMLARTPVVASAHAGHNEVLEDGRTGRLFPVDDIQAAAQCVVEVIDDPGTTTAMVERAFNVAFERYAPETHARAIEQIYDSVRQ